MNVATTMYMWVRHLLIYKWAAQALLWLNFHFSEIIRSTDKDREQFTNDKQKHILTWTYETLLAYLYGANYYSCQNV